LSAEKPAEGGKRTSILASRTGFAPSFLLAVGLPPPVVWPVSISAKATPPCCGHVWQQNMLRMCWRSTAPVHRPGGRDPLRAGLFSIGAEGSCFSGLCGCSRRTFRDSAFLLFAGDGADQGPVGHGACLHKAVSSCEVITSIMLSYVLILFWAAVNRALTAKCCRPPRHRRELRCSPSRAAETVVLFIAWLRNCFARVVSARRVGL
jgi:hypothetical protein